MPEPIQPLKRAHRSPPGPRGHFLFGSLPEIQRNPLEFLTCLAREYGDVAKFRFAFFKGYLVSHPEAIKHILQDNNRNYNKDNFDYKMLKPVVGEGLLTSDDDLWLRQRRLIQPAFHRQRIQAFGSVMTETTLEMLERWHKLAAQGEPIDAAIEMMRLTLRIVGKALFGQDIGREADVVGKAFAAVNADISARFRTLLSPPLFLPTPGNRRLQASIRALNELVNGIIQARRAAFAAGERGGTDLLAMLLEAQDEESGEHMSDRQLRDEVMTLLLAGHETTANNLSWTWYLLSQHHQEEARLHAELGQVLGGRLPEVADLANLPYTRRVVQEALRLYPPAWILSRKAIQADELCGYAIPANAVVEMSPYIMHHHPRYWDDPAAFDPERFTEQRAAGRPAYAYFPFGGGPRLCIGRDFALLEAQLILATVAQRFRLRLVPGHPVELEPLVTLRPKYGLRMMMQAA